MEKNRIIFFFSHYEKKHSERQKKKKKTPGENDECIWNVNIIRELT